MMTRTLGLTIVFAAVASAQQPTYLAVSNELSRDVMLIDPTSGRIVATIPVGERPRGIHATSDGSLVYVALSDDQAQVKTGRDAIAAIDVARKRIVARLDAGTDPEQFAIVDRRSLYAANEDAGTAMAFDLQTNRQRASLIVGIEPEGVAASPDGRWVYVTAETSNSVSVIDTRADSVVANFLVDVRPRAAAWSPDGSRVYVTNEISGTLSVIDGKRHRVVATIPLDNGSSKPVGVAVSPDGRRVYVANGGTGRVSVVDARTLRQTGSIDVGRRPWNLAISRDGRWLYTANGLSDDVAVVDLASGRVVKRLRVGRRPWGIALVYQSKARP
jgi:PQQ-dependent catabolism-associated beta-propeller protein